MQPPVLCMLLAQLPAPIITPVCYVPAFPVQTMTPSRLHPGLGTAPTPDALRLSRLDRLIDQLGEHQLTIKQQVRPVPTPPLLRAASPERWGPERPAVPRRACPWWTWQSASRRWRPRCRASCRSYGRSRWAAGRRHLAPHRAPLTLPQPASEAGWLVAACHWQAGQQDAASARPLQPGRLPACRRWMSKGSSARRAVQ